MGGVRTCMTSTGHATFGMRRVLTNTSAQAGQRFQVGYSTRNPAEGPGTRGSMLICSGRCALFSACKTNRNFRLCADGCAGCLAADVILGAVWCVCGTTFGTISRNLRLGHGITQGAAAGGTASTHLTSEGCAV